MNFPEREDIGAGFLFFPEVIARGLKAAPAVPSSRLRGTDP